MIILSHPFSIFVLISGFTRACLKSCGITPSDTDKFIDSGDMKNVIINRVLGLEEM